MGKIKNMEYNAYGKTILKVATNETTTLH